MKKHIFLLSILLIVGVCVMACGKKKADDAELNKPIAAAENQFDATVLEVYDEYIMVEALASQDIVGEVRVQIGLLKEDEIPALEKGDTVRITHDGRMTMSLPPQMTALEICLLT